MQKIMTILSCAILISMTCTSSWAQTDSTTYDLVTVKTKVESITQDDIDMITKEAAKAVDVICSTLDIKKEKVSVVIIERGISNAKNGYVEVDARRVKSKRAPIVHEVTHLLAGHEDNKFFSEGLAIYFQEKFGEGDDHGAFRTNTRSIDDWIRFYEKDLVPINRLSMDNNIFKQVSTEERKIAYIEAGSFFIYLADAYGTEKLKELHKSWTLNYKKVYGKKLKELEAGWKLAVLGKAGSSKIKRTYIEIKEADKIGFKGKVKYEVSPGDVLEIIDRKPCKNNPKVECWEVKDSKTGENGFVRADQMKSRHSVYSE